MWHKHFVMISAIMTNQRINKNLWCERYCGIHRGIYNDVTNLYIQILVTHVKGRVSTHMNFNKSDVMWRFYSFYLPEKTQVGTSWLIKCCHFTCLLSVTHTCHVLWYLTFQIKLKFDFLLFLFYGKKHITFYLLF